MTSSERLNSLCLESEEWVEKLSQLRIFNVLEEAQQEQRKKTEENSRLIRSRQDQNKELENQLDTLKRRQDTLINDYSSSIEQIQQLEADRLKQKESIVSERTRHVELDQEIQELEKELMLLEKSEELDDTANDEALLLALYHGLGIQSKIEDDNTVKTVILTSSNEEDILTLAINDHPREFRAKYVWNFISK